MLDPNSGMYGLEDRTRVWQLLKAGISAAAPKEYGEFLALLVVRGAFDLVGERREATLDRLLKEINEHVNVASRTWEADCAREIQELENGLFSHFQPCTLDELEPDGTSSKDAKD